MAQGALIGAVCHASQDTALDAYYSAVPPAQTPGSTSYLAEFVKEATGWKIKRYSIDSSGQVFALSEAAAPGVIFPECDTMESFNDGMLLGWGVVIAMVAAWCVANLKRGM